MQAVTSQPVQHEKRPPKGILVFPFMVGTALALVLFFGIGGGVQPGSVAAALAVGAVAAGFSLVLHVGAGAPTGSSGVLFARRVADRRPPAGEDDPLANVKAVESQGRRHTRPCPNCGTAVGGSKHECPNCGHMLLVACKGCRTRVRLEWGACPECGRTLP